MLRRLQLAAIAALVLTLGTGVAASAGSAIARDPVLPDPSFLPGVPGKPCTPETPYEKNLFGEAPVYGDKCKRITFTYGPIVVKPGQMDAPLEPVDIEKPAYDGYIVRFKPDLVYFDDGGKPRTDQMHLHHATWLNAYPTYGDGPFFAAGEEKTIGNFPLGYGMRVQPTDSWLLLYMVHNAMATTERVWITYDVDFVAAEDAAGLGIVNAKPFWLDVQKDAIAEGAPSTGANPVFNVQKGFGHVDEETGRFVCRWPDENCSRFDVYGNVTPQQGEEIDLEGQDILVREEMEGTLVALGGHVHPGSIRNEVDLVRDGVAKPIFISDALYWKPGTSDELGGPMDSWNLSKTATGAYFDWKVKIKAGDHLRINTVVDSQEASWYENMGIVVAYVATEDPHAPAGVDVFEEDVTLDRGVPDEALVRPGPWVDDWTPHRCTPDLVGPAKTLCLRGQVTHDAVPESGFYGGCSGDGCAPVPGLDKDGPVVTEITASWFSYGLADFATVDTVGIPRVKRGQPLKFVNADAGLRIPHTFTRCAEPCTGPTGVNYPLANGGEGPFDQMDFDSTQIGYGFLWEPTSGQIGGDKGAREVVEDGSYYELTPTDTGTYTFWCRIHPSMRGVFEVVE